MSIQLAVWSLRLSVMCFVIIEFHKNNSLYHQTPFLLRFVGSGLRLLRASCNRNRWLTISSASGLSLFLSGCHFRASCTKDKTPTVVNLGIYYKCLLSPTMLIHVTGAWIKLGVRKPCTSSWSCTTITGNLVWCKTKLMMSHLSVGLLNLFRGCPLSHTYHFIERLTLCAVGKLRDRHWYRELRTWYC